MEKTWDTMERPVELLQSLPRYSPLAPLNFRDLVGLALRGTGVTERASQNLCKASTRNGFQVYMCLQTQGHKETSEFPHKGSILEVGGISQMNHCHHRVLL